MAEGRKSSGTPIRLNGWKCATQLKQDGFQGSIHSIEVQLEKLREELIASQVDAGHSEREAVTFVEDKFVGIKRPDTGRGGGKAVLYASKEAIDMLGLRNVTLPAPKSWRSATHLGRSREVPGMGEHAARKNIAKLRDELIRDVAAMGYSIEEANMLVEDHLVGTRRVGFGAQGLFASPDALRLIKDEQDSRNWRKTSLPSDDSTKRNR